MSHTRKRDQLIDQNFKEEAIPPVKSAVLFVNYAVTFHFIHRYNYNHDNYSFHKILTQFQNDPWKSNVIYFTPLCNTDVLLSRNGKILCDLISACSDNSHECT